jgi:23S rRNA (adenine2503-C2)-methyltransferase
MEQKEGAAGLRQTNSAATARGITSVELLGKSQQELREWMASLGEPAYRGAQVYHALYAERRFDFAAMTNLPAELRARLKREAAITLPAVARKYQSADGAVRYLLPLGAEPAGGAVSAVEGAASAVRQGAASGVKGAANAVRQGAVSAIRQGAASAVRNEARPATVEAVFMPSEGRQTICISTQAGCAVDCKFCLTATLGLVRNLSAGEIVGQVLVALEDNRERLAPRTNVVLMGQGEPLLNYDATIAAVRILLDPNALALSPRHVTLSTSGIVPGIERLAKEKVRPKLAVSLNASNDAERDALMPINRKYPIAALMEACRRYPLRPWERLTFEYVMLGGVNDSAEDARRVARLMGGLRAKVNLIPWNPGELPYRPPTAEALEEFRTILAEKQVPVFVRYSRGQDIFAACGQLAVIESGIETRA